MFNKLKKLFDNKNISELYSFAKGRAIDISEVNDPTFSSGMLGKGVAIKDTEGVVYAPCDAKVIQIFDTLHAVILESDGIEMLIHIGIDTVTLKGEGFRSLISTGALVSRGDVLIEFDVDFIKSNNLDDTVIMVICNTDDFSEIEAATDINVDIKDKILNLKK